MKSSADGVARHVASDHSDVVALIRSGFVDAGVCVRLVAEEAQTGFLSVCEEDYDLCFPQSQAADPRIAALDRGGQVRDLP